MWRTIKLGKNTQGHMVALRNAGYHVEAAGQVLRIWAPGPRPEAFAASRETLLALVAARGSLSYSTRIAFPDGRILYGVPAACRLGSWSFIMMKDQ